MRLIALLLAAVLSLGGCATTGHSPTLSAMGELALLERAELFPPDYIVQGDSHQLQFDNLMKWAAVHRIPVTFETNLSMQGEALLGYSRFGPQGWYVMLRAGLPVNTQFVTLVHELAHLYHAANLSSTAAEVFSELVAYQVAKRVGLNSRSQHALYLAEKAPERFQWLATMRFSAEIDAVANMLTAAAKGQD